LLLFCVAARGREKGCIPRFLPEKALAFSTAIDAILSTYLLQAVCFMIWGKICSFCSILII
jgi:hypothetical protein